MATDGRRQNAKTRARRALCEFTDDPSLMFLDRYQTSYSGRSISASLSHHFVQHHSLERQETLLQFFDAETGALVIIPEDSTVDVDEVDHVGSD